MTESLVSVRLHFPSLARRRAPPAFFAQSVAGFALDDCATA
ncbi:MAG: hypothetical protein ACR2H2_02955 [Solirubrobacteraceae bacterium]